MTWIPLFSISSQDFEGDLKLLKRQFTLFERKSHCKDGFKFSKEAQLAMGWWFYNIYVTKDFIRKLVEIEHIANDKIKDEKGILTLIQNNLKQNKSKARIKFHDDKPLLWRYWTWLLK